MKLIMQASPSSCHFLLGLNILVSTLFLHTFNVSPFLSVTDQVLHQHKTSDKISFFI